MTPAQAAGALRLAGEGRSQRQIAEVLGISHQTVGRFLRARRQPAASPPAALEPPRAGQTADESTLEFARRAMYECQSDATMARARGDATTAQRATRDAAHYATIVARLERTAREDDQIVKFPREDLERGRAQVEKLIAQIAQHPRLCVECGRAMRLRLATRKESDDA